MLLVIDNYDSFTYNVIRYLEECGASTVVRQNDEIDINSIRNLAPDGIVISPGPGKPACAGVSVQAIEAFANELPILGVCLGHQALGEAFGAKVVRAKRVMHGKTSVIRHDKSGLFVELPDTFLVARYHSLIIERQSLPDCLRVDAWVDDDTQEIMAISHRDLPLHGVQFHPEAVLSEQGHNLFSRFLLQYDLL